MRPYHSLRWWIDWEGVRQLIGGANGSLKLRFTTDAFDTLGSHNHITIG